MLRRAAPLAPARVALRALLAAAALSGCNTVRSEKEDVVATPAAMDPPKGAPAEKEDPAAKRRSLERKLAIARAKLDHARMEVEAQQAASEAALDQARREEEIAQAKAAQFEKFDAPNRIARAELTLLRAKDRADEAAEELQQIEIMYSDQDLADKTAEFVSNRGKRNAERSRAQIAIEERGLESLRGQEIPREGRQLQLDPDRPVSAVAKAARDGRCGRRPTEDAAAVVAEDDQDEESAKERVVTVRELPEVGRQVRGKEAGAAKIGKIEKGTEDGKVVYEAEWEDKGAEVELTVAVDGTVLEREVEKEVSLDKVPAAVKAAILKAAGDHQVTEVEAKAKDGKVVSYEAEWRDGEKEVELKVDPTGKVLRQKVEDDDDEEGEHEGRHEHHGHDDD